MNSSSSSSSSRGLVTGAAGSHQLKSPHPIITTKPTQQDRHNGMAVGRQLPEGGRQRCLEPRVLNALVLRARALAAGRVPVGLQWRRVGCYCGVLFVG